MKKFLFAMMLVTFMSCMVFTGEAAIQPNAILYSIDGNNLLRFNSVHTADVSVADIYDETGSGITTLASLKAILGTADIPPRVFQVLEEPIDIHRGGQRTLSNKAVTATLEIGQNNKIRILTVTGIRERPILGVSWSSAANPGNPGVAEGFERLGGYAVYLPRVSTAAEAQYVLSQLNGFAATGGEDWHPALYGHAKGEKGEGVTPHGSQGWNIPRDWSDYHMLREAVAMDVPLMGYCRGKQGFNIAMGGGLIQDVPYYNLREVKEGRTAANRVIPVPPAGTWGGLASGYLAATTTHRHYRYEDICSEDVKDDNGNLRLIPYSGAGVAADFTIVSCDENCSPRVYVDGLVHSSGLGYHKLGHGPNGEKHVDREFAGILPSSKWVYNIVGSSTMQWIRTAHHQFANPRRLGEGITVVAIASDGVIEAIEHQDSLFAVGVQWHPEGNVLTGPNNLPELDLDLSVAFLWEHVKYAGVHMDRKALFNMFKNGELPEDFSFEKFDFLNSNFLEYTELIEDKGTILSNSMFDGWTITGVNPQDAESWVAEVVGGSVVVTLEEDVDNGTVTVTLTKDGTTKDIIITFSGTKSEDEDEKEGGSKGGGSGCSAAHGYLALAFFMGAAPFIFSRRK